MAELPSGTVTFLLTDVEGSTPLWQEAEAAMRLAAARHDDLFEALIQQHGGVHIRPRGEGDSRFAVFFSAPDAVAAAVAIQRAFAAETWPTSSPIKVRIGIHTGEAQLRDGDYYGTAVNRCARIRNLGHGGQILISEATATLTRERLADDGSLLDLGRHRLRGLTEPERVFQVVAPGLEMDLPPLASPDVRPNNLTSQPTALLGRERELAEVRKLFQDGARLVTLTGPGGTGKTRLGLQVAADLLDDFQHGVFLVELAPITDSALVPSTIAQALGIRYVGSRPMLEALKEYVRARSLLLVLDNFEQILSAASVVTDLLAASPTLNVLVTSREPLRLRGEQEYAVSPLALPDPRQNATLDAVRYSPAVTLFVQRARAIRADFALTDERVVAVAEICARVDGLPLAIELAAARVRLMTPEAMVRRLERRLPLLVGGARDLPARQQALRDTIAWSYDLLNEQERRLFRRLAVFVGGWTLDAAEAVCNLEGDLDTLGGLESLVVKSLIRQDDDLHGDVRFWMLETIREYAAEQLEASSDSDTVRRRQAGFFLELAEQAGLHLGASEQVSWLRRLSPEHDNIRAVLAWSRTHDQGEVGLRLAGALHLFWRLGGHVSEGRRWLTELLALPGGAPLTRAQALLAASMLAIVQGDYHDVRVLARQSAEIFATLDERAGVGRALAYLGVGLMGDGRLVEARPILEESVEACREAGDRWGLSNALGQLASVRLDKGDMPASLVMRKEALAIAREQGDRWQIGLSLMGVARIVHEQGDHHQAAILYREAVATLGELDDVWLGPRALAGLASVAVLDGEYIWAVRLFGAAEAIRELAGTHEMPTWQSHFDRIISAARDALDEVAFSAAWAEGRAMTLEQAVAYALDEPPSASAQPE